MTVVDGEEAALGPGCRILTLWLRHVQDNRHAVFIVVSLNALMRVRRVAHDQAVRLRRKLCLLKVLQRIEVEHLRS